MDEESPIDWLSEVAHHGCVSGIVSSLIYYSDCCDFYDKFSAEIWEIVMEFCDSSGQKLGEFLDGFSIPISDDATFKNALAWFSVEETASQLLSEMENRDQ